MPRFTRVRGVVRRLRRTAAPGPTPPAAPAGTDAALLAGTPLFDHEWYAVATGRRFDRAQAVRHYLDGGWRRTPPHPLFSLDAYTTSIGQVLEDDAPDPFLRYLRERRFEAVTHPLLDLDLYLAHSPEALEHPHGPIGHYLERGAPEGRRPNGWYEPRADQPRGLVDWLVEDARALGVRREAARPVWARARVAESATADLAVPEGAHGTTTVVLVAEHDDGRLGESVDSLLAQTETDWELLVVPLASTSGTGEPALPDDPRVRLLDPAATRWEARNRALDEARGTHLAWLVEGDRWLPGRLRSVRGGLGGARWLHDVARDERPGATRPYTSRRSTPERLRMGLVPDLGTVVVETGLLREVGGFDLSLWGGQETDLVLRLDAVAPAGFVRRVGVLVHRTADRDRALAPAAARPALDPDRLESRGDRALSRHLVDWETLRSSAGDPGVVTVVVVGDGDWQQALATVRAVVGARESGGGGAEVQVVLVDDAAPVVASAVYSSLPHAHPDVGLVRLSGAHGPTLARNLALPAARGATVAFLDPGTEVHPGWLAPLLETLQDADVLAAQPLLLTGGGAVRSAGYVFPPGAGLPHELLRGFPVEDFERAEAVPPRALSGAALVVRRPDLVALEGFDPVLRRELADVDLSLRLAALRPGRLTVCAGSRADQHDRAAPDKGVRASRAVFLDRWADRLPAPDDVEAWERHGYAVVGHEVRDPLFEDQRLCVPEPVLVPTRRMGEPALQVRETVPRLRWAVKNPAPHGAEGDRWGDTHFAEVLADALRGLGQDVVVDRRAEMARRTGWTDDVVLLLRGLAAHSPLAGQVNLQWLISHPEMFQPSAQRGWDRIYVASRTFAERLVLDHGLPAVPLLQATEPARFHPDTGRPGDGPPLLFVGNSRQLLRPMVAAAVDQDLPLTVVGWGWEGLVPAHLLAGDFVPNRELAAAYRSAGVVLNDHWSDMARDGFISNRLFDAVAAGARVVSDPVPGVEEVFGDAVRVAHTPEELRHLVDRRDLDEVFGDDDVRRAHAARIATEHSFAARATVLLDDALAIRAGRS